MGIESFLISSTLLGVLAQRLVRKLCPHCKESDTLPTLFAKEFELPDNAPIFKASGCKECSFTGYHGRVAVGEILILDDELKELISKTTNDHTIREVAIKKGMITLPSELKRVLLSGDTSLEEVIRVGIKES
jgi:type II secretory ATPase GspE/PulE/Tfp pilus assembly ATPase PilB-like protein